MSQTASPADITAVSNILKKVYTSDAIKSQLNDDAPLYAEIQKDSSSMVNAIGDKFVGFVKTGRNVGTSSRSLNGGAALGAAGHQQTLNWSIDYTAHYIQIKILGTTIAKMRTARQAATQAVTLEVDGALLDHRQDINRQLYNDGTGKVAVCGTTSSSATINLSTSVTGTNTVLNNNDAIQNGWLQVGEYVDIGTLASPTTIIGDAKIVSVSDSDTTPTITIDSSVSTTANSNFVMKAGNQAASSVSYEMNGLGNIVGSGAFGGITDNTWVSPAVTATTTLSRADMQAAFLKTRKYGGKPTQIWTSLNHQADYYNLLQSQVRFAGDTNLASGNVDGPEFNKLPVVADAFCPRGVMYFLDMGELFMATAGDPAWQNVNTGGDVLAWSQGEDAFVARLAYYANLGTTKRRAHSKITGIVAAT